MAKKISVFWEAMPGKLAQRYECFRDGCCLCIQGSCRRLTIPSLVSTHASTLTLHPRHLSHIVSSTTCTENPLFTLACLSHPHPREFKLPSLPMASYVHRLSRTCPVQYLSLDFLEEGDSTVLRNASTWCGRLGPLGMEVRGITVTKQHRQEARRFKHIIPVSEHVKIAYYTDVTVTEPGLS